MSLMCRPLPTTNVGFPVDQPEGQLSGGELARPTGAGRPISDIHGLELVAPKRPVMFVPPAPELPCGSGHTRVDEMQRK